MPACSAATASASRRSSRRGARISAGRVATMVRTALAARLDDTGLRCTFHSDSSACDSASRPLASVAPAGRLTISAGSTIEASGQVHGRCSECLRERPASHSVAQGVTSLPVPAVVGIAISARCGPSAGSGAAVGSIR